MSPDQPRRRAPGAGRPPLPEEEARAHRVRVYLDGAELALLDALRGERSRSEYLVEEAGLRRRPDAPARS